MGPTIVPRAEHGISRSNISENSLKVLYRLKSSGFAGFLVGGGVRDLLLGRHPKDFDVVTDAHPEQIKQVFRNARLIGRRYRLAHERYGRDKNLTIDEYEKLGDGKLRPLENAVRRKAEETLAAFLVFRHQRVRSWFANEEVASVTEHLLLHLAPLLGRRHGV